MHNAPATMESFGAGARRGSGVRGGQMYAQACLWKDCSCVLNP